MSASAGFMGTVLDGQDPQEAWDGYREMIREDPQQQDIVRQFAASEGGRELLAASREAWRERGFEAPFDFLFRGEGDVSAQELR